MTSEVNVAFIIGTGRCGTSLLGQMLNSHSEVCVPPELQLMFEYDGNGNRLFEEFSLCDSKGIDADELSSIIERCCPHKLEFFFDYNAYCHRDETPRNTLTQFVADFYSSIAESYSKSWLIEQTPWYGQRLDILTNLFPRAKFIHMIRDGRDVALSFSRTSWWNRSVHLNLARWQREVKKISMDAAMYLNNSSYLEVKYENLVNNTEFEVRRICDFLGVNFEVSTIDPQSFIDYDKYSRFDVDQISSKEYGEWKKNKINAVFSGNVQAWKRERELFSSELPAEVTASLCRYSYDIGGEAKVSVSELHRDNQYSVNGYINSLEGKLDHLEKHNTELEQTLTEHVNHIDNVEADWNARGKHIAELEKHNTELEQTLTEQVNHIDNVEADWNARGKHIAELEKHNTEIEQTLTEQVNHIDNVEAALMKFKNSVYGKCITILSRIFSIKKVK